MVDTIQKNQRKEAVKEAAVEIGTEVVGNALDEAKQRVEGEMDAETEPNEDAVEVVVEGSNYKFSLAEMSFNPGEKVELTIMVTEGSHNFVIDEFDVTTDVIGAGEEVTVEFTVPDEPGEYAYYCSVGNHRALGMEGVLTVD